jgi:glycosyltransferase involved in cell wall biosynthesis
LVFTRASIDVLRVLFWSSEANFDFYRRGGIESTIRRLIDFLLQNRHEIHVFIVSERDLEKRYSYRKANLILTYGAVADLKKRALANDFDVINFLQTPFGDPVFLFRLLATKRRNQTKFIKLFFTNPPFKNNAWLQWLKHLLLIDVYIAFSTRLYERLSTPLKRRVFHLNPPVGEAYFRMANRPEASRSVWFVGRLSEDKGLDIVLSVFRQLREEKGILLGIQGYYATHGDRDRYSETVADLGINVHIGSRGDSNSGDEAILDDSILPLGEYDVLLLPYQDLNQTIDTPLLVVEGLVSCCKVVTSDIGGLKSLSMNLFAVREYQKPEAFCKAVKDALDTPWVDEDHSAFGINAVGLEYLTMIQQNAEKGIPSISA